MYIPPIFSEKDEKRIVELIHDYAFATLISCDDEAVPFATHLPLMLEHADEWKIYGHMAKANPQWQHFSQDREVLAIFQGPHAYISPTNYQNPIVPTWNYATVHLYGTAKVIGEESKLREIIESLSDKYEKHQASPWIPKYPDKLLDAIVGFELTIKRVEAKSKLSQNRPVEDRQTIINTLDNSSNDNSRGVAKLMRENEC